MPNSAGQGIDKDITGYKSALQGKAAMILANKLIPTGRLGVDGYLPKEDIIV